jgi:phage repressor protein C with HTH and peptisase S24 domain/DNA-binding XRE family transcriptional regulator
MNENPAVPFGHDMETGLRLRGIREKLGLTSQQMADRVGLSRARWSELENNHAAPSRKVLVALHREFGVRDAYVLSGVYPITDTGSQLSDTQGVAEAEPRAYAQVPTTQLGGGKGALLPALLSRAEVSDVRPLALALPTRTGERTREYFVIPRYMASAHAGVGGGRQVVGADQAVADAAGVIAFERTFMREELGRDGSGFVTVKVEGDSMERTLSDGETIVVDTMVDRVTASGIYVLLVGEDLIVKRVVRKLDGSLIVKSDNQIYSDSDELFSLENVHRIQVLGRMVWPKVR